VPRVLVLLAALLFGTTGTAQALGPDASPLLVGAARTAVGAALLVLVARLVGATRDSIGWPIGTLAVAAAGIAGYQLTFFAAVADTGVGVGTVVAIGSAPALAGLLARLADGTPLSRRWAACTACATAGVVLLVLGGREAQVSPPGVLLALVAGASYAAYTVAAKRLMAAGHPPEQTMARAFSIAALLLAPILVTAGASSPLLAPEGLLLALYLGAIPTALAYVLFARGLRRLSPGDTATLTLAEPLTAAALGALVLGERPGALAVAGGALVLGGLVALSLPGRRRGSGADAEDPGTVVAATVGPG
jgi:DME family drug/metabolite transporter